MSSIKLIVGLGNPGPDYAQTRHNAGQIFLSELADQLGVSLKTEKKFHGEYGKGFVEHQPVHLLFPTTYMNRSGMSVQAICAYFDIALEEVLVVHDELDLDEGVLRLKKGGGSGGNNGLKDIIQKFGGNKDFYRMRIGIGHPGHKSKVTGYVLGKLNASAKAAMQDCIDEGLKALPTIVQGNWDQAVQSVHTAS